AELRGPTALASAPLGEMLRWEWADWDRATRGTPARRAKFEMFLRNAAIAAGNAPDRTCLSAIENLARHESPIVAEAAQWAMKQGFDEHGGEGV
ncbi:MAG: hypothetical protein K8R91_00900, partial [Phycisphaerae bacterium]|nr:hypothetical protein [Phycisphaerae bacterium]